MLIISGNFQSTFKVTPKNYKSCSLYACTPKVQTVYQQSSERNEQEGRRGKKEKEKLYFGRVLAIEAYGNVFSGHGQWREAKQEQLCPILYSS